MNSKKGDVIVSNHALNESKVINNKIWNVPGHALRIHGLQGGKSREIGGNTVMVNPDEKIAGKDGRALLKIWSDVVSSDTTYTVYDNVVTKVSGAQNDSLLVRADDIKSPSYIKITMYNNSLDKSGGNNWSRMYGGTVYGYQLGALYINEIKDSNVQILVPSLNQPDRCCVER